MKYRKFGSLDWEVSVLSLGTAGLPVAGRKSDEAAEAACVRMIRYAIEQGVNHLDLGFPYDMVRQEIVAKVVNRALRDGYRERVRISLTVPVSFARSAGDLAYFLETQMEWLGAASVDFCVLGRINRENWPRIQEAGFLKRAEQAMSDGRVGSIGFAFHDHFQILRKVLNEYDNWTFGQFQFSYMDAGHDPGATGLAHAAEQGIAVVATEPLKSGRLAKKPPESVRAIWVAAPEKWSLAEWGLRFVWSHAAVSTLVCGVSGMAQLAQDITLAGQAQADALTVREQLTINRVRDAYQQLRAINCASCRFCMPCPQGIDVPRIFEIYNDAILYGDVKTACSVYRNEGHRADQCAECGSCEMKCARRYPLPIIDLLKTAHQLLAGEEQHERECHGTNVQSGQEVV